MVIVWRYICVMRDSRGISKMTDVEVLEFMQDLQRERANLDALMTRAMAHFRSLRTNIVDAKYAFDEVAAALSWSPGFASSVMHDAVELVDRLPDTVAA